MPQDKLKSSLARLAQSRYTPADNTRVSNASGPSTDSSFEQSASKEYRKSADRALNDSYNMNQHSIGRAFAVGHSMMANEKADSLDTESMTKAKRRTKALNDAGLK